ncbi:hypothetical protein TGME49_229390 [Toxoplasma gondii ME49]|uniref:Protein DA1-like domain-containing protein n=3 Tax=Toxoplasma gondii TaxID=5811 RepID=A0A0F7UXG7_TOXGV|nr:hypothetical protein TGME49_229390 [Toxoplasma gondii ME49]EPT29093.1 hypothetical protein TGME49_229390 [Toxoplasma gondii ME49]ESS35573.1 hypothetical protein TGVEG_229390 [Toxoplasma gondii VEG]KYF45919.1 hypothetical protein TGARI_229390 [Toxoplasma gondii ARI]CEL74706.1 TPA: hypothetical protein BN1205_026010 [Toxoplasma gondii VEG]|eukprot:XP_002367883.2 hypothetical protein TGME49_229390 [Toxoplasma gondii ME49]
MESRKRGALAARPAGAHTAAHPDASHSKLKGPINPEKEALATCAACGQNIGAGQRFIELSVTIPTASTSNRVNAQQRHGKQSGGSGVRSASSRKSTVKALFHLSCLRCTECGKKLSSPSDETASTSIVLCTQSAVEALTRTHPTVTSISSVRSRRPNLRATSNQGNSPARGALLQYFVAHEKCKERPCVVCHRPISLKEPRVALPNAAGAGGGGDSRTQNSCQMRGPVEKGNGKSVRGNQLANASRREELTEFQHIACTKCAFCGQGFDADKNSKPLVLFDQQRQPYHPTCLACCCCHRPLLGMYEVHEFFGKLDTCDPILQDTSKLLPLPAGLAAAMAEGPTAGNRDLGRGENCELHHGEAQDKESGDRITPKYGGLCCAWCSVRVPRCLCCERRCAVYQNESGKHVLPRAITREATAAAKMAADISLGKKQPPPQSGQAERGVNSITTRAGVTASSATELFGDVKGVVCGQCASLPHVTTESELRDTTSWVGQALRQAGIVFTQDMIRLQKLIKTINEEEAQRQKGKREKPWLVQRASAVVTTKTLVRTLTANNMGTAETKKKTRATSSSVVTCIDDIGVPIELVHYSTLNSETPPTSGGRLRSRTAPSVVTSAVQTSGRRNVASVRGGATGGSAVGSRIVRSTNAGALYGRGEAADTPFSRTLFGRCHVQVITLNVAGDSAVQFDAEVKAQSRLSMSRRVTGSMRHSGPAKALPGLERKQTGTSSASSSRRGDMQIGRKSTLVGQNVLDVASAYAAALEGDTQSPEITAESGKGVQKGRVSDDRSQPGHDAVVEAGALLHVGSFAGGLLKTKSGIHIQGLSVLSVERICVVGSVPRVMVVQHMGHEWLHAYLACKQKKINDNVIEEGACNVAATEVLLRFGAELRLTGQQEPTTGNVHVFEGTMRSDLDSVQYEMLILRYRMWKMKESRDPVYGEGYRKCVSIIRAEGLSLVEFVRRLLKG